MATLPVDTGFRRVTYCALVTLMALAAPAVGQVQAPLPNPPQGPMMNPGAFPPPGPPPGFVPGKPAEEQVVDVRVEGNRSVSLEKILPQIRTRAGRPYDVEQIEEDVRRLNKTRLFVTVRPLSKQVPGGRLVIFQVVERPLFQDVKIIGTDSINVKTLKKEINLKTGDAADPFAVEEGRRKIEEFYHGKGFSKVRVTIVEGNKPGDLRAIYMVNEGPKQRILWVNVIGNSNIVSAARLKSVVVKSKPPILYLFKGEVDKKQIDEDVDRITAYYRGLGFFLRRVGRELQFYNEKQNWLVLNFVIDEGPRYSVRNVSFMGNTKYATDQLREKLKLKDGQYFNQSQMTADVKAIQEKYGSIGYVFADVKADPRFLDQPGQLDLMYNIDEGARYRVGRINVEIKGENPHTKIVTVLNRLSLKPGDIVDVRELHASERRLKASGLFLVDPTKGSEPRIVIKPPELDDKDKEQVAGRPKRQNAFYRGPGGEPYDPRGWPPQPGAPSLPPPRPGERYVDVLLQYENADDYWHDQQDPEVQPPAPRGPTAGGNGVPTGGLRQVGYGAAPPPNGPVSPGETPMVVRGQYTEGGFSTPDLPPRPSTAAAPYPSSGYPQPSASAQPPYQPSAPGVAPPGYQYPPSGQAASPAPSQWSAPQQYAPPAAPITVAPAPAYGNQVSPPSYQPPAGTPPPAYGPPAGAGAPPYAEQPVYVPGPVGVAPPPQLPPSQNVFGNPDRWLNPTPSGEPLQDLPLTIRTEETQTGRLMFGVGVNSDAGVVGSIVLDEQNFDWTRFPTSWEDIRNATAWRGAGQRFRVEAVPGTQVQRYMVTFQEPYLFYLGPNAVSLGLSGFYYDRIYTEWRENREGGRVSLGYQLTHDLTASVAFRGMNVNINNPEFPLQTDMKQVVGNNGLYGFGTQLTHDTRDNAFMATEGHLIELAFEQVVGSFKYPHTELEVSQYFKLYERPDGSGRHVLSLSGRMGVSGDNTPIFERYFAGGFSTLRGFRFRGVSPIDPVYPMAIGGDFELLATIQYLFPITADDMLRGVVFCDTGTVEPSIKNWNEHYRVAPGFGLRVVIPAMGPAPIALDFAFPVSKQLGDQTEIFSFFVGFNR